MDTTHYVDFMVWKQSFHKLLNNLIFGHGQALRHTVEYYLKHSQIVVLKYKMVSGCMGVFLHVPVGPEGSD